MARKRVLTPDRELGLNQPVQPAAKRRVRRRQVPRAPLWQTYSGLRPWKGKTPTLRPGERHAEQPLFMRYSGLGLNQPERSRSAAGRDPNYAMRQEGQRERQHDVGMAREAREGGLIERREAAYHRAREQLAANGVRITPEVDARLRKSYGLAGVPADEGQPSRRFGEYTGGRPMPGKVTGTQQTIYGDLPKNYYERQREMMGRGLVYVRSMNKWMTPEMRDELSRHKWGKVTREHGERIERGEDRGFFNISTPGGETLKLSGDEMRAITQLGKGATRGEIPEGLRLTPEQISNIRRYHRVVERTGEAARLEQAEGEYERQLDRLGEWQDVAGAGEPGRGMANIREGLMERAVGALDEVDVARGAIGEARPEFRDRMAMLDQVPQGEFAEAPQAPPPIAPRPEWMKDERMVDEKAWMQRIDPYLPKPEPALPAIPKERDVGKLALEQQWGEKQAQDAVVGTPGVSQLLMGGTDIVAAVNDLRSLIDKGMTLPQITRAVQGLIGEADPAVAGQFSNVLGQLGRTVPTAAGTPTGAPSPDQRMGMGGMLKGIAGQVKRSAMGFASDYAEPIIAAVSEQNTNLGFEVAGLIEAARANPTPAAKKAITDRVYNMIYSAVLTDMKAKPLALAKRNLLTWPPRPGLGEKNIQKGNEATAREIAGQVNIVVQKMIYEKLGV